MERCISPNEKEMKRCISSIQSVMINISPEMYGSFQNFLSTIFFSSHELTVSFTMHTFLISNFISLQLELGHPVQNHRPDIDQPMPESDSEISDGDQISSDLIALILKSISAVRRMLKYSHFPQMTRMRSNQSLWIIPP